nr:hypothetical protein [Paraburkholderia tropica]
MQGELKLAARERGRHDTNLLKRRAVGRGGFVHAALAFRGELAAVVGRRQLKVMAEEFGQSRAAADAAAARDFLDGQIGFHQQLADRLDTQIQHVFRGREARRGLEAAQIIALAHCGGLRGVANAHRFVDVRFEPADRGVDPVVCERVESRQIG